MPYRFSQGLRGLLRLLLLTTNIACLEERTPGSLGSLTSLTGFARASRELRARFEWGSCLGSGSVRAGFARVSHGPRGAIDMEPDNDHSQAGVASLESVEMSASSDERIACNGCKNQLPSGSYPFRMSKHRNRGLWNYCDTVSSNGKSCLDQAKCERAAAMNAG